jgi:hypothetical protein
MSRAWQSEALFFRQVHPTFCDADGLPLSSAFNPTPKDSDRLSVDDAALVSAQASWRHYTSALGLRSVGTWAVSYHEITEPAGLTVSADGVKDEAQPERSNPAHCAVDFSGLTSKGQKKRHAQRLAMKASERGCVYQP